MDKHEFKIKRTVEDRLKDSAYDEAEKKYVQEKILNDSGFSSKEFPEEKIKEISEDHKQLCRDAFNIERDAAILAHATFRNYVIGKADFRDMKKHNDIWIQAREYLSKIEEIYGRYK